MSAPKKSEGIAAPREPGQSRDEVTLPHYDPSVGRGGDPPSSPSSRPKTSAPRLQPFEAPKPGDLVGHYELIRLLGRGGMGSVFLARDNKLGRRVAIKFLDDQDPALGKRFVLEARTTARCSHENIVVIYEADECAGHPYMVLEYLQGQSLTRSLPKGKPIPVGRAVELMIPVVKALACAHGQGIVHRDLKPDNILLTESGTIKVLDFGIAKLMQDQAFHRPSGTAPGIEASVGVDPDLITRHDSLVGTLSYMSPEQWGADSIDPRSDIWTVGVILFRLLHGKHPLHGRTGTALAITAELDLPMPGLLSVAPGVPAGLAQVVDRCLRKRKAERFPDAHSLLRALEPFQSSRPGRELKVDETPYAGLASFQESDSNRFFGRTQEIAGLVNRLRDQPMVAVVGSSGSGKSSFVRAGLLPALKRSGERWEALVLRPGRNPLEALADALGKLSLSTKDVAADLRERKRLVERLRQEPGYAGAAFRSHARRGKQNLLLFIDQFEELYTLVADPAERLTFTTCLSSIADDATSPARVILSVRSDFLDRISEDPQFLAELSKGLFFLRAPTREGLADALVQPAEMAGYRFESPNIVEDMLTHLEATQGALPLLQFAASMLWENRDPSRQMLTLESYQAMGGIAGALASHADSVLNQLPAQARALARTVLPRLVTAERTRALVSTDELRELSSDPTLVEQLVDQLVRARLLVVQTGGGGVTVELVHESLITGWPLLRRWLDEGRDDLVFREQLRTAARQWHARGSPQGLLWRGEAMQEARLWRTRHQDELPAKEQAFLSAVAALATRAQRVRRAAAVGTIAVLSLVVAGGAVALVSVRRAERSAVEQAELAQAAELAVKEQLERVRQEQEAKTRAQAEVQQGKEDLRGVNAQLQTALEKANSESKLARTSAERANELAGSLQEANASLSKLLAAERARAERLEQERKKITTELR